MSNPTEEAGQNPRVPRFYATKEASGWTWGYRRPGEPPPAGVRLFLHTRQEAEELAAELARKEAEPPPPEPVQLGLSDGSGGW